MDIPNPTHTHSLVLSFYKTPKLSWSCMETWRFFQRTGVERWEAFCRRRTNMRLVLEGRFGCFLFTPMLSLLCHVEKNEMISAFSRSREPRKGRCGSNGLRRWGDVREMSVELD